MSDRDRDRVLASVASLDGWMSPEQGERLWDAAAAVPSGGAIVEIGSYRGKSTVVLGSAAPAGVSVTAIDPHAGNDRGPRQIHGQAEEGQADHEAFWKNLDAAGLTERVHHVRRFSHDAPDAVPVHLDVLYIDGAHGLRAARDDLVRWGRKVRPGGLMLVHDAYSAVGVTLALLTTTVAGRSFRYLGRDGSLARYRREQLRGVDRFANAGRQLLPLAWFARNLVVKLLLVAHLGQVARLLGHDGETWPF